MPRTLRRAARGLHGHYDSDRSYLRDPIVVLMTPPPDDLTDLPIRAAPP